MSGGIATSVAGSFTSAPAAAHSPAPIRRRKPFCPPRRGGAWRRGARTRGGRWLVAGKGGSPAPGTVRGSTSRGSGRGLRAGCVRIGTRVGLKVIRRGFGRVKKVIRMGWF